jgi:succinylglutamic semialdehyde dehydrogenase
MIEPDGRNFINGVWIKGGGSPIESVNPYTGQVVWRGNSADQVDVDSAVQAAGDALPAWKRVEFEDRMEIVRSYCDLVSARRRDLIEAISAEIGKPMWEAETEVNSVIAKLEPGVESLRERCSTWRPVNTPSAVTRFLPIGAVGVIGPFNFPIHMPNVHIMPALLAGNTVVWKQTEAAPLAGSIVASLWAEAGLPAGVLNLLHGGGATGSLVSRHAGLKGVYFTCSEKV